MSVIPDVLIIMGSESDKVVMDDAAKILAKLDIDFNLVICSAHRLPEKLKEIVLNFEFEDGKIIIAGAGMAAHLPGVVASMTRLPVIGVPIALNAHALRGQDALYSIVQMPPGMPIATMAINGAKNAALFAAQILNLINPEKVQYEQYFKNSIIEPNMKKADIIYNNFDYK